MIFFCCISNAQQKNPYEKVAPVEAYLMPDREKEIALARSSAPDSITKNATVMVLTRNGYEVAVKGTNGYVCLVARAFTGNYKTKEFWSPKHVDPICYNSIAARTVLPHDTMRTNLAFKGLTKEELRTEILKAYGDGRLKVPEAGAIAFMMSKEQFLGEAIGHWHPHIMFYVPYGNYFDLGVAGKNSPTSPLYGEGEALTCVLIPVQNWSDGSKVEHKEH